MKKETWEALQRSVELEEKLRRFTELCEKALLVVDYNFISLSDMKENFDNYWVPLYQLKKFPTLEIQNSLEVEMLFEQVRQAIISKKEFREALLPSKQGMEKYAEELKQELQEKERIISSDYDKDMAEKAGICRFAVEAPEVKELFFQWLKPEE